MKKRDQYVRLLGFSLCSIFLLLSGCKTILNAEIYASDLFRDDNLTTPASMKLEIPSCSTDTRNEYESSILALFSAASQAKVTGCKNEGMESLLSVAFLAEMATGQSSADLILFRNLADNDQEFTRGIKPVLSPSFVDRVRSLMRENYQTFEAEDLTFTITLNNDEQGNVAITTYNSWVDGEPHESLQGEKLVRRGKVEFRFSNVTSDLLLQGEQPNVLWVVKKKSGRQG